MYFTARPELPDTPPAPGTHTGGRRGIGTAAVLLGVTSLFTDASAEMVTAILPIFLTLQVGLSPLQYGFIDGLYQGGSVLVRLVAGYASDRSSRPKAIAGTGYALSAVSKLALLGVGTSLPLTGATIAADRIGKGIRSAPRDALIAADADPAMLGRAFGVHRSMDTIGAALGPLLGFAVLVAAPGDYNAVFLVSLALAVIGLAVLVLFVRESPPRAVDAPRVSLRRAVGLVRDRTFALTVAAATVLAVLTLSDAFLYLVLQRKQSVTLAYFPLLFLGTAAVFLVLAVPVGHLADRIGRLRVFLAGHVALLGAYAALQVRAPVAVSVTLTLLLLGTYYAATDGVLAAAVAQIVPAELRSSGIALAQTAVAAGRLFAAVVFGLLWTWFGRDQALLSFTLALVVCLPVAAALLLRTTNGVRRA